MARELIRIEADGTVVLCPEYREIFMRLRSISHDAAVTWLIAELQRCKKSKGKE